MIDVWNTTANGGIEIIRGIGSVGFELFLVPTLWWTLLALLLLPILIGCRNRRVGLAYQLHFSVLLLLPLSVLISLMLRGADTIHSIYVGSSASPTIRNPNAEAINSGLADIGSVQIAPPSTLPVDFSFWLGVLIIFLGLISLWQVIRYMMMRRSLNRFARRVNTVKPENVANISKENVALARRIDRPVRFCIIDDNPIPFTFGYSNPLIIIPDNLLSQPEQLNMAIRHELIHVRRKDYLVYNLVLIIRSLFWFHPMVHRLTDNIATQQEQLTDKKSVQSSDSRGAYMRLLYDMYARDSDLVQQISQSATGSPNLLDRIEFIQSKSFTKKNSTMHKLTISALLVVTGIFIGGFKIQTGLLQSHYGTTVTADTTEDKEYATFQFRIEKDENQYILNADKGTNWKQLTFECEDRSGSCLVTVTNDGLTSGDQLEENEETFQSKKFAFTLQVDPQNQNRLILKSGKGTDWKTLSITFTSMYKSWTVNQLGVQPNYHVPEGAKAVVSYIGTEIDSTRGISDQWKTTARVNGNILQKGDTMHIKTDEIEFESTVRELDHKENYGKGVTTLKLSELNLENFYPQANIIRMKEKRGTYKGNEAEWKFKFMVIH